MNSLSTRPVVSEFVAPALAGVLVEGFKMQVYADAISSFVTQTLLAARGIATADEESAAMDWADAYRDTIARVADRHGLSVNEFVEMSIKSMASRLEN